MRGMVSETRKERRERKKGDALGPLIVALCCFDLDGVQLFEEDGEDLGQVCGRDQTSLDQDLQINDSSLGDHTHIQLWEDLRLTER